MREHHRALQVYYSLLLFWLFYLFILLIFESLMLKLRPKIITYPLKNNYNIQWNYILILFCIVHISCKYVIILSQFKKEKNKDAWTQPGTRASVGTGSRVLWERVDSSENSLFLIDTDNDTEPDSHLTDRVPAERALEQHLIQSHFGLDCPRLHITHYVSVFPIPPHCLPEKLGRNRS